MRRVLVALLVALAAAAPAAAATVPELASRSDTWLEQTLRVPIPDRPVVAGTTAEISAGCAPSVGAYRPCIALAQPDRIILAPTAWRQLVRIAAAPLGARVNVNLDGLAVLHDQLHSSRDRVDRPLDEGIVDALAVDLLPAWLQKVARVQGIGRPVPRYPEEVAVVREASARAAGAPWGSRAARAVRRAWWALDSDARDAAVRAALS